MKLWLVTVMVAGLFAISLGAQDATRGGALYKQQCALCHGEDLKGRSGPPLEGGDFGSRWPTSNLTDKIKNTMPQDNPGKLSGTQAADLAAYIQQTGQSATNAAPPSRQILRSIFPQLAISSNSCAASCSRIPISFSPFRRMILPRKRRQPHLRMADSIGPRGATICIPDGKLSIMRPSLWPSPRL